MNGLLEAFSVLFVVIGPIDNAAAFAALTKGYKPARRRRTALKAIIVSTVVMVVFAIFGDELLSVIGVKLESLEIAGGILLLLAAIQMVMAEPQTGKDGAESEAEKPKDISVFPMAMPLIAGPDAITAVVLLVRRAGKPVSFPFVNPTQVGVILVMLLVLFLTYLALLGAGRLLRILGSQGIEVVTRVLGLLLAALAVEFIIDGLSKCVLFSTGGS